MPLYEFEDIKTGKVIQAYRSVENRDSAPAGFRRIISAPLPTVTGFHNAIKEDTVFAKAPKALANMDGKRADAFLKSSGFTKDQIKKAWSKPVPMYCREKW